MLYRLILYLFLLELERDTPPNQRGKSEKYLNHFFHGNYETGAVPSYYQEFVADQDNATKFLERQVHQLHEPMLFLSQSSEQSLPR